MKVKELVELLKRVNPDADILVDINDGDIYNMDTLETDERNYPEELSVCQVYILTVADN